MTPDPLERIRELTAQRAAADRLYDEWRQTIRDAANAGIPAVDIARAAGITPTRVTQIKQGKR